MRGIALHQYKIPEASESLLSVIPQLLHIAGPYMIFKCAHFVTVRNFVLILRYVWHTNFFY